MRVPGRLLPGLPAVGEPAGGGDLLPGHDLPQPVVPGAGQQEAGPRGSSAKGEREERERQSEREREREREERERESGSLCGWVHVPWDPPPYL